MLTSIGRLRKDNRALVTLVMAGGLSGLGDSIYLTVLPVLIYQETGDAFLLGLAVAGRLVPFMILSVPAGVVADRFDRRHILMVTESVRFAVMALAAGLVAVDAPIGPVIALSIVAAAAGAFASPAQGSLIPELAHGDDEMGIANSVDATFEGVASMLGPAMASILLVVGGATVALAINAMSFIVVIAAVTRIPRAKERAGVGSLVRRRWSIQAGGSLRSVGSPARSRWTRR